jgi:hypothetical protein
MQAGVGTVGTTAAGGVAAGVAEPLGVSSDPPLQAANSTIAIGRALVPTGPPGVMVAVVVERLRD